MLLTVIRFGDLSPAGIVVLRGGRKRRGRVYASFTGVSGLSPPRFSTFFSTAVENFGGSPYGGLTASREKPDFIPQGTGTAIDTLLAGSLVSMVSPFVLIRRRGFHDYEGQTYFSAESPASQEDTRLPRAHVYEEWPAGAEAPSRQGP